MKNSFTKSTSTWTQNPDKIILFDNGAYEIKHSTGSNKRGIKKFQNCKFFEKMYNSDTAYFINDIKEDFSIENLSSINRNYSRPLSRGLLNDVDLEAEIWEEILAKNYNLEHMSASDHLFIFTHTPFAPDEVIEGYFQIIFEYFGFNSCIKSIPHIFSAIYAREKYPDKVNPLVQLVVDSGFSSTTIVPVFDEKPIYNLIKRIDIGGKLLTNHLKESLINTIDLDLRKEFFLVNLIKEECCYVSKNFNLDMKISSLKNSENNINKRTFILPEYRKRSEEYLKKLPEEKYAINMNNLRFLVPELIFNPNMIGLEEGGLHEGINQIVKEANPDYKNLFLKNIVLSGGNTKFLNFKDRLKNELTPITDLNFSQATSGSTSGIEIFDMDMSQGENVESVLSGMKIFSRNTDYLRDIAITKQDYNELGFNAVWKNCL
jgi:actin-related protein 6